MRIEGDKVKKIIYIVFFILVSIGLYKNMDRLQSIEEDILKVWVSNDEFEVLSKVNKQFEEQYGAKIEMKIMTSEQVVSNLPLYVGTPDYPDIITLSHTLISELVKMNAISPISDIFDTLNILPSVKSGFKLKGEYYGVPYNADTDILFYNKLKFLDGLGSFNTLDDYSEIALAIDYQDIYHIMPFVTGFGGYIIGNDNFGDTNFYDIGLNKEESILGLSTMLPRFNPLDLRSRETNKTCATISPAERLRINPICPVAQNAQFIGQPTCVEIQTVFRSLSSFRTDSVILSSEFIVGNRSEV